MSKGKPARVAVFASGNGSNFEAIMENWQQTAFDQGEVVLIICNKQEAGVLKRAEKWQVPAYTFFPAEYADKNQYEQAILNTLNAYEIDFIVLAGYMRLLGPVLLKPYAGRIVNLHPSLLPAFPGKDAIGQALEHGVRVSGITIHYVDEGMDTGPIIYQEAVVLDSDETRESLSTKIHAVEHRVFPEIIKACLRGQVVLEGRRVKWLQPPLSVH